MFANRACHSPFLLDAAIVAAAFAFSLLITPQLVRDQTPAPVSAWAADLDQGEPMQGEGHRLADTLARR